jgi:rhodanese-related sulfurtransferase
VVLVDVGDSRPVVEKLIERGEKEMAQDDWTRTQEDLAGYLFDSLRNKIMVLEDEVVVYPGHGAGSACGKMMSKETTDTLKHQKEVNYALRADMTREEFVEAVTEGLVAPPQYFPKNAVMNKMGYESIDHILEQGLVGLTVDEFEKYAKEKDVLVIDTRPTDILPLGFVPGSVFVGIDDNFAPWIGALIEDLQTPIIFVADEDREEEVVTRLARVGYDNPQGYLSGGFDAWKAAGKHFDTLDEVTAEEFARRYNNGYSPEITLLDVRKESEYNSEHVEGATNFPLDFINQQMDELDPKGTYFIHCQGGYRSLIAATMLRKAGFYQLVNIKGGYKALKETDLPKTQYVEPTTML